MSKIPDDISWPSMTRRYIVFLLLVFSLNGFIQSVRGQHQELNRVGSDAEHMTGQLPTFYAKDSVIGSPYLSSNWMIGVLEFSDHRKVPEKNQYLYFNYDKFNQRVIVMTKENLISFYPVDSVAGFALADGDKIYSFEKISGISNHFFLEPVVISERGYSLYKRIITQLRPASYRNEGYYHTGEKHDEFVDAYEYYLLFPDKRTVKKFYLKESAVRKVFKNETLQWADINKDSSFTVQNLVSLIDAVNSKK